MYLKEIAQKGVGWIDLIQDGDKRRAVVNVVMKLRVS
jgi:hypothetical protein